jgi:hypothetical protein
LDGLLLCPTEVSEDNITIIPYLKSFIEWWLGNRTDSDGWFHCKCSWESGQDGSKRFLIPGHDPGGVADFVRTVDVEAVMAEAMKNMVIFAQIARFTGTP